MQFRYDPRGCVLGPNDPRALRDTGRTWKDSDGKEHPIMVDGRGREVKVQKTSFKDLMDNPMPLLRGDDTESTDEEILDRFMKQMDDQHGNPSTDESMKRLFGL